MGKPTVYDELYPGRFLKAGLLKGELHRKANEYEVSTLRSTVGSLEYSVRELSATCDVLRSELSQLQENFREALNVIQSITTVI